MCPSLVKKKFGVLGETMFTDEGLVEHINKHPAKFQILEEFREEEEEFAVVVVLRCKLC